MLSITIATALVVYAIEATCETNVWGRLWLRYNH
jgi:hypothetical protein